MKKSHTGLPKILKCGIIEESCYLIEINKEYVLALDGKQTSSGLIDEMEGDVNLWGYEGPPTVQENIDWLRLQENCIINVVDKASRFDTELHEFVPDLKIIVQIVTKCIKSLREAKVRYEQLRSRFKKKICGKPHIRSRYDVAFSEIDSFIRHCDIAIKNLLNINVEWCSIMATLNGNEHCFHKHGPLLLDSMLNSWILRHPDTLDLDTFLQKYPQYMKQRTDVWHSIPNQSYVTGSTLNSALGL